MVQALVPPLNNGNANALISKLENAKKDLEKGHITAACNKLGAFINQVEAFIQSGKLTPAQGQPLIDCAEMIRAALGCTGAGSAISDFDGDGKTDLSVWDGMNTSFWQIILSSTNSLQSIYWGRAYDPFNDVVAPGDYDGDGKADAAVFRRSNATWYIKRSSDDQTMAVPFGLGTDLVVPADYDGDGLTDIAVFRANEGRWYIKRSYDNQIQNVFWSLPASSLSAIVPVPGDYDGDSLADLAVFSRSTGYWHIKYSNDDRVVQKLLGDSTVVPVPADYDGDGKTDIAIWNGPTTYWHIIKSTDGTTRDVPWGRSVLGDIPVPGDFDGDGLADIAVWRSTTGTWYIQLSQSSTILTRQHGSPGFVPIPAGPQR